MSTAGGLGAADKIALLASIARWRLTWKRRDLDHHPGPDAGEKVVTAREAVRLIGDGSTVISCGMAGNARCSIFFWALRERFERSGHARGLTWISVGAQGGRSRVPGTVEELALPGLLARYISGHVETARALLRLAAAGKLEIHVLPQGEMTHLIEGQAHGRSSLRSITGVGTFLDPRSGRGSPITPGAAENLIEADGDMLGYRMPPIDVALFSAPYADAQGNIYFNDAATITENVEAARAAQHNGGQVLAAVADIVERDSDAIGLPAELIDAVVVNPRNEQTALAAQRAHWPLFTPGGDGDDRRAEQRLKFINRVLHITPPRGPVEEVLARLGARVFAAEAPRGARVNIGVGYPEEVCRLLFESPLGADITFTTETGVYGGLPAPGVYFGAAVNPQRIESSAWMFHRYAERLDVALLGFLQVDSAGNVNVSRRGPALTDYVGPGGMPSIAAAAGMVIFVGAWMAGASWSLRSGELRLRRPGRAKFVEQVDEITFSGAEGLRAGKRVFYVTHVGVFRLTAGGLELAAIMPGIDLQRDVLEAAPARIRLPEGGPERLPDSVLTGEGFELRWAS